MSTVTSEIHGESSEAKKKFMTRAEGNQLLSTCTLTRLNVVFIKR